MKNVLIIEDDSGLRLRYQSELDGKVTLYFAGNLSQAQKLVREKIKELDIISFDLFLSFEEEDKVSKDTIELIEETKKQGFNGIMIASSDTELYRKEQLKSGCNSENIIKKKLAEHIISLIS